jgi:hypothetical protein
MLLIDFTISSTASFFTMLFLKAKTTFRHGIGLSKEITLTKGLLCLRVVALLGKTDIPRFDATILLIVSKECPD